MSVKKQFLKSKPVCKVSFKLSKELAAGAAKATLVGDFNNWSEAADEMNSLKDGSFSISLDLETGRSYQFRYLLDGANWVNDEAADAYEASGFGDAQNAVIVL
jgi:1,4-alpha-glucan branching enzyme